MATESWFMEGPSPGYPWLNWNRSQNWLTGAIAERWLELVAVDLEQS